MAALVSEDLAGHADDDYHTWSDYTAAVSRLTTKSATYMLELLSTAESRAPVGSLRARSHFDLGFWICPGCLSAGEESLNDVHEHFCSGCGGGRPSRASSSSNIFAQGGLDHSN